MTKKSPTPATKQDLRQLERHLAIKIAALDAKLAGHDKRLDERLLQLETRIMSRFDLLVESMAHDFREANTDKIAIHDDQLRDHAARIVHLEKAVGFST